MNGGPTGWNTLPLARVPFGWRAFLQKYTILRQTGGISPRLLGELAGRLGLYGLSQSAWLLDMAIAPGWRHTPLERPIFIIGHQRSGTTLMHRLLAADRTHARALCLHEMLLPAVSFQRALAGLHALDRASGGRAARAVLAWQDRRFARMDPIHRIRFHEIEEDEFVFWAIFASAMCVNDAPGTVARPELDGLRDFDAWPLARKQAILGWYRACLMKKLYREPHAGGPAWIVAKNPAFSQKIPMLREIFPDARFVHLWRDPLVTIPSRLSLIRAIWWERFGRTIELSPAQVEAIVDDSIRTYARADRDLKGVPEEGQVRVDYNDFIRDVPGTVRGIYRHFQLPPDDVNLNAALQRHRESREAHTARHEYTLEEFGLNAATLADRLK